MEKAKDGATERRKDGRTEGRKDGGTPFSNSELRIANSELRIANQLLRISYYELKVAPSLVALSLFLICFLDFKVHSFQKIPFLHGPNNDIMCNG